MRMLCKCVVFLMLAYSTQVAIEVVGLVVASPYGHVCRFLDAETANTLRRADLQIGQCNVISTWIVRELFTRPLTRPAVQVASTAR